MEPLPLKRPNLLTDGPTERGVGSRSKQLKTNFKILNYVTYDKFALELFPTAVFENVLSC